MKIAASSIGGIFVVWLCFWVGFSSQPWSPWWQTTSSTTTSTGGDVIIPIVLPPLDGPTVPVTGNRVSDVERFQLITAAGASSDVAVVMTALSIAEDGSGDPTIHSAPNWNKTVDLGLWQINSIHWPDCGGEAALMVPSTNARCAMSILGPSRNYCAWSTYEERCGVGHNGAYRAYMAVAQCIAEGRTCQH